MLSESSLQRASFSDEFAEVQDDWDLIAGGCGTPLEVRGDALVVQTIDFAAADMLRMCEPQILAELHERGLREVAMIVLRFSLDSGLRSTLHARADGLVTLQSALDRFAQESTAFWKIRDRWSVLADGCGRVLDMRGDALIIHVADIEDAESLRLCERALVRAVRAAGLRDINRLLVRFSTFIDALY